MLSKTFKILLNIQSLHSFTIPNSQAMFSILFSKNSQKLAEEPKKKPKKLRINAFSKNKEAENSHESNEDPSIGAESPIIDKPLTQDPSQDIFTAVNRLAAYVKHIEPKAEIKLTSETASQDLKGSDIRHSLSTNRSKTIADILEIQLLIDFLEKPQNKILLLAEKHAIFEKFIKFLTSKPIDNKYEKMSVIKEFLNKYKTSMKVADEVKHYVSVFNLVSPKCMYVNFEEFYTECMDQILKSSKLKPTDILHILPNLHRFYYNIDMKEHHSAQVMKQLSILEGKLDKFNIQNKMHMINLMRYSKTYNDGIMDYMLYYAEMNFDMLSYEDILNITLTTLAAKRINPFELMYRLRTRFNQTYKELRPFQILRTLNVYSKIKMHFMEQMYENIFKTLGEEKIVKTMNQIDGVMILNYYSKVRYKDDELFERYLKVVLDKIKNLPEIYLKILLLTLADLNYPKVEIYLLIYQHFNLIRVIDDIKREETLTEFENQYFKAICDYVAANSHIMISKNNINNKSQSDASESLQG